MVTGVCADPSGFASYLLPRPIRKTLTAFSALACFFGALLGVTKILVRLQQPYRITYLTIGVDLFDTIA